jgi:hypothetical protein
MYKNDQDKMNSQDSSDSQEHDGYSEFLSEWKSSALYMAIGLVFIIGTGLLLLERHHLWQKLF